MSKPPARCLEHSSCSVCDIFLPSFLSSSLGNAIIEVLLSSSCPHESISGQMPHFICCAVYLRTIRPTIQVLGPDKNSSSPNALGQCGCYSGGWVCGCRWVSKGLAVKRKELQKLTPQQPRWCWSHSTFP